VEAPFATSVLVEAGHGKLLEPSPACLNPTSKPPWNNGKGLPKGRGPVAG
jgi:hypothetical protein